MEVLGAVSIIASLAAFTSSSVTIIGQVARSSATISTLSKELTIIEIILRETEHTLRSFSVAPDSIKVCLEFCLQKRQDVFKILDKIAPDARDGKRVSLGKKWRMVLMSSVYESEVVAGYNSFRDSVLLLRDLTSDIRMDKQMVQISSAMGLYLHEQDLIRDGRDHHDGDIQENDNDAGEHGGSNEASSASRQPVVHRRQANKFLFEFTALMQFDFTRDVIVLIEVEGATDSDKYEHVPLRNKVDPGTTENFINRDILLKHRMNPAKITDIPAAEQDRRAMEQIEGKVIPKQEVTLLWHLLNDARQRQNRFIVVEDVGFDVLIGAKQFSSEAPSAMWAWGRSQSPEEIKKETERREQSRADAWKLVNQQRREARSMKPGGSITSSTATQQTTTSAGSSVPRT